MTAPGPSDHGAASARRRLDEIVATVPGVVWEAWGRPDAASQRIDFVSRHVETMLGWTVEEWLGAPNFWLSIVHPDDRERAAAEAAELYARGTGGRLRFRWIARDGRVLWVDAWAQVVLDEGGEPAGMRGVTLDVTAQVRAEQDLRAAHAELERRAAALQLANDELDQYANIVSHDLKTPLRAVRQCADFLRADLPDAGAAVREDLDLLENAVRHAETLVDALLDLCRVGTRPVSPGPVALESVAREVATRAPADAAIELHGDWPEALADEALLRQVLQNLVENGLKFNRSSPRRVRLSAERGPGEVRLRVSDNGIGIDARHHDRIFRMFERLHAPADGFPGSGMGLAIVRKAAARMGGDVRLERSEPGAGSTFLVTLPESSSGRGCAGPA